MSVILVPFDGSPHALKALHIAMDLTTKYKAPLVLVHVAAEKTEALLKDAQRIKAVAEGKMRHRQVKPLAFELLFGAPADCILLTAKRHKATTIVMGCRGRVPDDRGMFGSVSQDVFRQAECTCISVK